MRAMAHLRLADDWPWTRQLIAAFDRTTASQNAAFTMSHQLAAGEQVIHRVAGDPGGRASERSLNDAETVAAWTERIRGQLGRLVDLEHGILENNYEWTAGMSAIDFLRDVGKHFTVNYMLAKESVSTRLNGEGISFTEFSYMLLQSLDFQVLYDRHGCTLQIGGSDQWGNITAGVELVRRADGAIVHALATPLVTKADGTKFGKTETGTVWLDPAKTSPYAFYQFFVRSEDAVEQSGARDDVVQPRIIIDKEGVILVPPCLAVESDGGSKG